MERLFSPCTRLHDLLESQGRLEGFQGHREGWQELNLDVASEEFLSAERAFTYADLYAMLGNKKETVLWLTPHAAVAREDQRVVHYWEQLHELCRLRFNADGKEIDAWARSPEHLLEICHVVLRLLGASVVHLVFLQKWRSPGDISINATCLVYLMEQCQSLKVLTLVDLVLDENHCRVLGAYSRPGLEIVLDICKLTSAGTNALAEVLKRNQGPTKLDCCDIDYSVLADGLRGNSRLKTLRPRMASSLEDDNRQVLAIAGALQENKGLLELNLCHGRRTRMCDETWDSVCDSLKTHATLEVLNLSSIYKDATTALSVQALLDMMKTNMSIHTIHLNSRYWEHELFWESVIPYLETNRFRPRVRAIQKTRPITYRAKVLGRALLSGRTDANSFWMLLSGNAEVVFLSTAATTTLATDLPTPATAVATSNAAAVAASS
jgi:hypothetical protein